MQSAPPNTNTGASRVKDASVNSSVKGEYSGENLIEAYQKFRFGKPSLETIAKRITVKVTASKTGSWWGSGVLIYAQNGTYTVITNQHVIDSPKITITTFDGKTHNGKLLVSFKDRDIDLAVVQFVSNTPYKLAKISNLEIAEGEFTLAAGYPHNSKEFTANNPKNYGLRLTNGYVTLNLGENFSLRSGYQIGYTSVVETGMSGGPILNKNGDLIAINAKNSEPYSGPSSYRFQDETLPQPCKPLADLIFRSSLAIPVNVIVDRIQSTTGLVVVSNNNDKKLEEESTENNFFAGLYNKFLVRFIRNASLNQNDQSDQLQNEAKLTADNAKNACNFK